MICENLAVLAALIVLCSAPGAAVHATNEERTVAILRDGFAPRPADSAPELLGETLESSRYDVTYLDSKQLANKAILTHSRFDCLVLPYGSRYPYAARDSIKAYLKSGGSLLSTGGYAFDEPCAKDAHGRMLTVSDAEPLNTRHGRPADTLRFEPDQIGVFDPGYHLRYVTGVRAGSNQDIIPASLKANIEVAGYSACSLLGSNSPVFPKKWGRHISIVEADDEFGRYRGDVGAMVHNYAGPYAKSSWAFFGVTNTDLFSKSGPMLAHLSAIVNALVAKTYLHSLSTDLALYRDGETVNIECLAANMGRRDVPASVEFAIFDRDRRRVFRSKKINLLLKAGGTESVQAEYQPNQFTSDLYRVTAQMTLNGKTVDTIETGFVADDLETVASGPKLRFKNNYFHFGERPVILSGTNATGAIFCSGNENPLVWDQDLARMSDNGQNVLRVLHFSPFVVGAKKHEPIALDMDKLPISIERKLDALVQLCQRHKIVLFPTLHDWMPVELSDEELAAQHKFANLIAARYKDVPGFMIDIQNEPSVNLPLKPDKSENPRVVALWNDYLRGKYGSDDALKAAWDKSPPQEKLGKVPYLAGTDDSDDRRTRDADWFRNVLHNRWAKANYDGAKEGDPDVLVTVGFLQEYFALNKLACVDGLDFANMHSYNPIEVLRADMKLFDRRFQGKSISLGEFGSLADHNKRTAGEDNPGQDVSRYLLTEHYLVGEGGSMLLNWCWKDMDDVVFPWGINYTCNGPAKDILKAYRNMSLLFGRIKPIYKPPPVFLVAPLERMVGGKYDETVRALYGRVNELLNARADFGVIDDQHLNLLPKSAKALVYSEPIGRFAGNELVHASDCHAFRVHDADGGRTIILVNMSDSRKTITLTEPETQETRLELASDGTGMARFDKDGKLTAVESQGPVTTTDGLNIPIIGHAAIASLDGKALGESREMMILGFGEARVDLTLIVPKGCAHQVGEIVGKKWKALSESVGSKISLSGATGFDLAITGSKNNLPSIGNRLVSEMAGH